MPAEPDANFEERIAKSQHRNDRDRFALAAMAAMLDGQPPERVGNRGFLAKLAYEVADAMLVERDKEKS